MDYRKSSKENLISENQALRMEISQLRQDQIDLSHLSAAISDRKRSEKSFKKINDALLNPSPSFIENINLLTGLCGELTGATYSLYSRIEGGFLYTPGQWNTPPGLSSIDKPDGHICYDVITRGGNQVSVINDLPDTPYLLTDPAVSAYNLVTCFGKAVVCDGEVVGSICAVFQTDIALSLEHEQIFTIIASAIGNEESRNHAQKKLLKSEERFRSLVENAFDGIYLISENRIIYANHRFYQILGYSAEEIASEKFDFKGTLTDKNRDKIEHRRQARMRGEETPGIYEFEIITKTGEIKEVEVSTVKLDTQNEVTVLGIMRDITERNRLFEELVIARDKAEEVNILKSRLLANMSHEIRTPLNGILGFAELIREDATDDSLRSMAEIIYTSGHRLLHTLNAILDLSVIESQLNKLNLKTVSLNRLADEVVVLFKPTAMKKGIDITFFSGNGEVTARADEELITKILNNLISNAIKFTLEGSIVVKTTLERDGNREFGCIGVTDTGIGIKIENQKIIFDEFRQVSEGQNRNYDGSGLGLHISKRFAEMMGGAITVKSKFGVGSTFTLWMPLNQ